MNSISGNSVSYVHKIYHSLDRDDFKRRQTEDIFFPEHTIISMSEFLFPLEVYPFSFNCKNVFTLRKHAYSNILKTLPPKNENFQIENSDIFYISAQNIDCGYIASGRRF